MKKLVGAIGFILILFCSACTSTKDVNVSKSSNPNWLDGSWIGKGYQLDALNNSTWAIELEMDAKSGKYTVAYPSLECSGKWDLFEANDHRAVFKEIIEVGTNRCFNGGKLVITKVDKNHLSYTFFYPDDNVMGAYSTLVRMEEAQHFGIQHL